MDAPRMIRFAGLLAERAHAEADPDLSALMHALARGLFAAADRRLAVAGR